MKILHLLVFPLWGSGSGTYVRKLAEEQVRQGHEVAVVAPEHRKVKGVRIFSPNLPLHAAFTVHPEWPDAKRYSDLTELEISELYVSLFDSVIKAIQEFMPDVVHVHHCSIFSWVASYLKSIYNLHYIVSSHGTCVMTASIDSRYVAQTSSALQRAEYIVPVSGDTRRWLLKVFGQRLKYKTRIITGGIDLTSYPEEVSVDKLNKKYKLDGKRVVMFAGKLTRIKGVDYLIKAAPKINSEIFIVGDGEERENLEQLAHKLKAHNVHFLGYLDKSGAGELKMFYKRADVVVFPSVWDEPLGLVALEAMASSTPVVASKKGGIPLAVKNNFNGILVRARSYTQIAEAVNRILADPILRQKFAENARKTAVEKFSWCIIAKQFEKLYLDTCDKSSKTRQARKIKREQELKRIKIEEKKQEILSHGIEYL